MIGGSGGSNQGFSASVVCLSGLAEGVSVSQAQQELHLGCKSLAGEVGGGMEKWEKGWRNGRWEGGRRERGRDGVWRVESGKTSNLAASAAKKAIITMATKEQNMAVLSERR